MDEKECIWERIDDLKATHRDADCLAVIDEIVELLEIARGGTADICGMVAAGPLEQPEKERILEAGLAIVYATSICP